MARVTNTPKRLARKRRLIWAEVDSALVQRGELPETEGAAAELRGHGQTSTWGVS